MSAIILLADVALKRAEIALDNLKFYIDKPEQKSRVKNYFDAIEKEYDHILNTEKRIGVPFFSHWAYRKTLKKLEKVVNEARQLMTSKP